jgi:hypothetical protein
LKRTKGFNEVEIVAGTEPGCRGAVFLIHDGGKSNGVDVGFLKAPVACRIV